MAQRKRAFTARNADTGSGLTLGAGQDFQGTTTFKARLHSRHDDFQGTCLPPATFFLHAFKPGDKMTNQSHLVTAMQLLRDGDWDAAHEIAQEDHSAAGSLVHAHLHKVEGDLSNARYWYGRAGISPPTESVEAEWEWIVDRLSSRTQ